MAKALLKFSLYRGGILERRESIARDIVKVGTDPRSHLRIDDESASRIHAVVEVAVPEEITLIDLGNEPGTFVDGERIKKCKLHVGDEIEIGETKIVLEAAITVAAESEPVAAAAPAATTLPRFAAPRSPFRGGDVVPVPDDAPPGTYAYALVKCGPDVSSQEVELSHVQAVEVMISWGSNVLHISHLSPPRSFYVGEEQKKHLSTDFFLPAEKLGTTRLPVVLADTAGTRLVIPPSATGHIEIPGQPTMTLDEARRKAEPCDVLEGAHQLALFGAVKAKLRIGDFVFHVAGVNAGKPLKHGVGAGIDWNVFMYFGLSLLAHAGLIGAMAFFTPALGLTDDEGMDKDRLYLMNQFLNASAERQHRETESQVTDQDADKREGGTGTPAKGEQGSMGKRDTEAKNARYAVQGPHDNPDPHITHQQALREALDFGMLGLLHTSAAGDPNAPTAPWGRDTSLGRDDLSAMGNMWGDEIGNSYGAGLGLAGIGEGGGGRGEGIGIGFIGTLGHGAGTGTDQGFGPGTGRVGGTHRTKTPRFRVGTTQVNGRLPAEVIQRIVRQNYGRFRMCYEQGLAKNPNLEGHVTVRFVIGRDGSVSNVSNGASDIPDSGVVQCVVQNYYGLSFPQPEGGIVTVVYPILFSPG